MLKNLWLVPLGGAQIVLGEQFGVDTGFENSLTGVLGWAQVLKCLGWAVWGVAQVFKNPWLGPLRVTQIFRKICAPWGYGV